MANLTTSPDLASLYGTGALEDWQCFLAHFDLGDGFSLLILLLPGPSGDRLCEGELRAYLDQRGQTLSALALQPPAGGARHAEAPARSGSRFDDWRGLGRFLSRGNHPRLASMERGMGPGFCHAQPEPQPAAPEIPVPLIFAGAPWLQEIMREAAPTYGPFGQLWSVFRPLWEDKWAISRPSKSPHCSQKSPPPLARKLPRIPRSRI